jgi:membrane-associated phospholipid phosphatase
VTEPTRVADAKALPASQEWADGQAPARPRGLALRAANLAPVDLVVAAYLAFTSVILLLHPRQIPGTGWLLVLRAVIAVVLLACSSDRFPARLRWLHDFLPIALTPLFYEEIGHLNRAFTAGFHDNLVVGWEQAVFGGQPSITLRRMLPQVWLSEYLHFAYFSYYFLGPSMALLLYLQRRRAEFRVFMGTLGTSFFSCMTAFIFFPVQGPFHHFTPPEPGLMGPVMPHVVHWVLRGGSSLGSAFPSSHVAVSMTVLLLAWRFSRPAFWVFLALVPALAVGAVYGGFHYAIDALAGFGLALVVCNVVPGLLTPRPGSRTP